MEIGFNCKSALYDIIGQLGDFAVFLETYFARIELQINCFKKIFLGFDQHDLKLNFRMLLLLYVMRIKVN